MTELGISHDLKLVTAILLVECFHREIQSIIDTIDSIEINMIKWSKSKQINYDSDSLEECLMESVSLAIAIKKEKLKENL